MKFWVVSSCTDKGKPAVPEVFREISAADKRLTEIMIGYWGAAKLFHTNLPECPEDWRIAQSILAALHTDGSWLWYDLTEHEIEERQDVEGTEADILRLAG
jgi:hypothetical protein